MDIFHPPRKVVCNDEGIVLSAELSGARFSNDRNGDPDCGQLPWPLRVGFLVAAVVLWGHLSGASADTNPADPVLEKVVALAGLGIHALPPAPLQALSSPTRDRQLPFFQALMREPLRAAYRVGVLESAFRADIASPHRLMTLTGSLAGAEVVRGLSGNPFGALDEALLSASDPLQAGLQMMVAAADDVRGWTPVLPDEAGLPRPFRTELARLFAVIGEAERLRRRAFADLPDELTPSRLVRQAVESGIQPFEEPDFRRLLARVERNALMAGMQDLVAAVEDFEHFLATTPDLPPVAWRLETPLGLVVIDTTGADNDHGLHDALLVVDVGGDDTYTFTRSEHGTRIAIVLDRGGNDRYVAADTAAGPGAAVLGYGILWDTDGDDRYEGGVLTQAAALFGAALLIDGGGDDVFSATGYAQAFALGGAALLVSGGGDDRFHALTHAQASAGPEGAAVLVNVAGNDRYTLGNDPVVQPSAQLPERNVSMGQGAGRGIRADFTDGRSTTGGIGALFDFEGDDHYVAQVFAQGAGYFEGVGVLVDGGGRDVFDAAWYAMAASAHRAAGVLVSRGDGDDRYTASHSTAIGAAHDLSMAIFIDEGGDDAYALGDLGLGATNDNSLALFVDVAGDDRYTVQGRRCRAFGAAPLELWGTLREDMLNLGLFLDLGGRDAYPANCVGPANDAAWAWPRRHAALQLRSEAGAGVDGEYPAPFPTQPRTTATDDPGTALRHAQDARRAWRTDPRYPEGGCVTPTAQSPCLR